MSHAEVTSTAAKYEAVGFLLIMWRCQQQADVGESGERVLDLTGYLAY